MTPATDDPRRLAAAAAVAEVEPGMVLGLGSGRTAALAVQLLAARIAREGLRVVGIPTSERTAVLARRLGVPLTDFAAHRRIDLAIDGADQVEGPSLHLVKGLGGALLREKIVAAASSRMLVVVDASKLVPRLGDRTPLPVEIAAFGWQATCDRLAGLGAAPTLRTLPDGAPFRTDGGNLIADCRPPANLLAAPARLERSLTATVGVVETGLFLGLASRVLVGTPGGVRVLDLTSSPCLST
ncbi:MAG: ribose 5-phosphate isomerase A [Geminicoccaceae bacterium]